MPIQSSCAGLKMIISVKESKWQWRAEGLFSLGWAHYESPPVSLSFLDHFPHLHRNCPLVVLCTFCKPQPRWLCDLPNSVLTPASHRLWSLSVSFFPLLHFLKISMWELCAMNTFPQIPPVLLVKLSNGLGVTALMKALLSHFSFKANAMKSQARLLSLIRFKINNPEDQVSYPWLCFSDSPQTNCWIPPEINWQNKIKNCLRLPVMLPTDCFSLHTLCGFGWFEVGVWQVHACSITLPCSKCPSPKFKSPELAAGNYSR